MAAASVSPSDPDFSVEAPSWVRARRPVALRAGSAVPSRSLSPSMAAPVNCAQVYFFAGQPMLFAADGTMLMPMGEEATLPTAVTGVAFPPRAGAPDPQTRIRHPRLVVPGALLALAQGIGGLVRLARPHAGVEALSVGGQVVLAGEVRGVAQGGGDVGRGGDVEMDRLAVAGPAQGEQTAPGGQSRAPGDHEDEGRGDGDGPAARAAAGGDRVRPILVGQAVTSHAVVPFPGSGPDGRGEVHQRTAFVPPACRARSSYLYSRP